MNKIFAVIVASLVLVSPVAAQEAGDSSVNPGFITPDIPVAWQIDRGIDSLTKSPGAIAEERAAEAQLMEERGNVNASIRAVNAARGAAENAGSEESERLQNVENILTDLQAELPTEAQEGLSTALSSVREAQNRPVANAGVPV